VERIGLASGFVEAVLAGNTSFFERMAHTSRQLLDEAKSFNAEGRSHPSVEIDYELLADMVAAKIKKEGARDDQIDQNT
jgi:hypothetical protein